MIRRSPTLLVLCAALACASTAAQQDAAHRPSRFTEAQQSRVTPIVSVAAAVGPAVVNIYQEVETAMPWPYNRLFGRQRQTSTSLGSGVIVDPTGFIITNAHVLQDERGIQVRLLDGSRHTAELVNHDPANDLALLKIDSPQPLPAARLGTSSDVMVGESIVAIGNPLGNENSVTTGIVSSVFRDVAMPGQRRPQYRDFIQVDAPINPGNSGGPLLNIQGDVIGINWAIAREGEGIGFAIPIDRVRASLMDNLLNPLTLNEVDTGFRFRGDAAGRNVQLSAVTPDGIAERAGLRQGDRLVSVRGVPVQWEFDVHKALFESAPGDLVQVVVDRGGERIPVSLTLGGEESAARFLQRALGLSVVDHPQYFGVLVESVDMRSDLPFRPGDHIDAVNRASVNDVQDLYRVLASLPARARVDVHLFRGGQPLAGTLRLP